MGGRGALGAIAARRTSRATVGVVLALLLNAVRLAPGEAIYLGAGNVHAYLRGTGVEVMANSDNVLRCGLTAKHVDVAELLRVADFSGLTQPRWPAANQGVGADFSVPVEDFRLLLIDLDADRKPGREAGSCAVGLTGPCLLLCLDGGLGSRSAPPASRYNPAGPPPSARGSRLSC